MPRNSIYTPEKTSQKPSILQSPMDNGRIAKKLSFSRIRSTPRNHNGPKLDFGRGTPLITLGDVRKTSSIMRQKSDSNKNKNLKQVFGVKKSNAAYLDVDFNGRQTQPIPARYFSENHEGNFTDRACMSSVKRKQSFTLPMEILVTPDMDSGSFRHRGSPMPKNRSSRGDATQRKIDFSQLNENNIPKFLKSSQNMSEK